MNEWQQIFMCYTHTQSNTQHTSCACGSGNGFLWPKNINSYIYSCTAIQRHTFIITWHLVFVASRLYHITEVISIPQYYMYVFTYMYIYERHMYGLEQASKASEGCDKYCSCKHSIHSSYAIRLEVECSIELKPLGQMRGECSGGDGRWIIKSI